MDWQPIETAPQQKKVLVGYKNSHGHWRNVTAIYYPDDTLPTEQVTDDGEDEFAPAGWYETSETHDFIYQTVKLPTHWMPLPAPPNYCSAAKNDITPPPNPAPKPHHNAE